MTPIVTDDAPAAIGPYAQAIRVDDWLFTSGQLPLTLSGEMAAGIEAQTEQVFDNLAAVLKEAGTSLELDRTLAAFDGDDIPSLTVEAEVRFPDADARNAFMRDYMAALKPLLKKHGARRGDPYRVAIAVYPDRSE